MKKVIYIASGTIFLVLLGFVLIGNTGPAFTGAVVADAVLYKSSSCGCCGLYSKYIEQVGIPLQIISKDDISYIKLEQGVPSTMQSCHTMIINGYFVEGHIPVEAINKLLTEKPDIKGIAMPGMPSGSPGMPGSKQGSFVVYAIGLDGEQEEFMRI